MRQVIHSVRFSCDGWFYRGGKEYDPIDCPNTLRLTGTHSEIEKYFTQSGWKHVAQLMAESAIEKHLCPRRHGQDSLHRVREPEYVDEANSPVAQGES